MEKRNLEALRREHESKFNKVQPKRRDVNHSVFPSRKSEEEESQALAQSQMTEKNQSKTLSPMNPPLTQ